jgi:ribose transport system substrate-binding protein
VGLVGVAAVLVGATVGAAATSAGAPKVALATKLAHAAMRPVKWTAPGPPIAVGKNLQGKKVQLVSSVDNQFSETAGKAMQAAGKVAGVTVYTDYTNGTLTAIQAGIQQAITKHVDALAILSVPPEAIAQPIRNAISHGIPVIMMGDHDPGPLNASEKSLGIKADITGCYSCAGATLANFVVSASKGKAHALFINSPDIGDATLELNGFKRQLHKLCPACTVQTANIPVANWTTQITSTVASALSAHPDINYIVPVFDTMEVFVTPAVKAANAVNRVKLASFNASEAQMKEMQSGAKPAWAVDGGFDLTWWGWSAMDDILRVMLGKRALPSEAVPQRFFTHASSKGYDFGGSQDPWYGNPKYVAGFKKLWGISH